MTERILTPAEEHTWAIYERLWMSTTCTEWPACKGDHGCDHPNRVRVHYEGMAPDGQAGWFHPGEGGRPPEVVVVRPYYGADQYQPSVSRSKGAPLPPPDLREELITLAHEIGHLKSWRDGHRTADYVAAVMALEARREARSRQPDQHHPLGTPECRLILEEEHRAWRRGRRLLKAQGFTEWDAYDWREADGIAGYANRFAGL